MVRSNGNFSRSTIIEMRECDFVLGSYLLSDDNFVDVVEFVPIFVFFIDISEERLKFRTSRNSHIKGFSGVKGLKVKKIEIVFIYKVT